MSFQVATFNIRNGDADDGPNSWPHRKAATVEMIRSMDADFIGLQEVMKYQLDFILEGLEGYAYVGVGRIDGAEVGEFAPILYRKDSARLLDSGWFMISETPEIAGSMSWNTACERICTWAKFPGFTLFNTHLDHVSAEARLRGVELILGRAAGPAIVTGDFNALPSDLPIRLAVKTGFQDAGAARNESTFHDWGRVDGGRIDYILGRDVLLTECRTFSGAVNGRMASDHHAVAASVELGGPQSVH